MYTELASGASSKKTYSTPKLTTHGNLATLTQSLDHGDEKKSGWDYAGCGSHFFDKPWYDHLHCPSGK